ncbi:uncharacterized protein [Mytilus edulis]|uniref:uncharacterized protein n=1 Tax=Mytilus edulis TaxID=6550 RepID=UPI0039EE00EF
MNLRSLCHDSKQGYNIFKQDGGNKCETNILWVNCKLAKKKLRQAQRQLDANNRYKLYYEIMDSYTSNQKLFYKLINIQRTGQVKKLTKLVIDGINLESSEEIRDGWASYFEKLSTLSTSSSFCDHQHQIVKRNIQNILTLQNSGNKGMQYATLDEVTAAISKMKNGKSPDELNLMSEHLKCDGQIVPIILKALFDRVLQERDVPEIFQSGIITPIHKSHDLDRLQNKLQRGFTKRVSPTNAALLLTEALADGKDRKKKVCVAFIDASKAFDVVWHDYLMLKLFQSGVKDEDWFVVYK